MASPETLCLHWNEYENNIKQGFSQLRDCEDFFDVTLTCGGPKPIKAHRVILSACSSFFRSMLKSISHPHPFLYLRGIKAKHLESILAFMYNGEVRVESEELDEFLLCAQDLRVNGLVKDTCVSRAQPEISYPTALKKRDSSRKESPPVPRKKIMLPTPLNNIDPYTNHATDQEFEEDIEDIRKQISPVNEIAFIDTMSPQTDSILPDEPQQCIPPPPTEATVSINELLDAEIMKYVTKDEGNGANFYCLKCSFKSTHKTTVKRHVESRHFVTDGFRCDQCGKVYKTRETLSKHLLKIHKGEAVYFSTA